MTDPTADIIAAMELLKGYEAPPAVHVGDRAWPVVRAMFYADGSWKPTPNPNWPPMMHGAPIYAADPDVAAGVVEFRYPDGRVASVRLIDDGP